MQCTQVAVGDTEVCEVSQSGEEVLEGGCMGEVAPLPIQGGERRPFQAIGN